MIISHEYRFIFIKTRKTAGTSIEVALSEFLGEDDVITPISPKDEELRSTLGYRGPRNYLKPFPTYDLKDWARLALRFRKAKRYFNHIPARTVRDLVGPQTWSEYFTFTIERNPFDKFLSYYFWLNRNRQRYASIADAIARGRAQLLTDRGGWGVYTDQGGERVIVDEVFRFEDLPGALRSIADRVGLPSTPQMVRTKMESRSAERRSHREILSNDDRSTLTRIFSRELEHFGYEF